MNFLCTYYSRMIHDNNNTWFVDHVNITNIWWHQNQEVYISQGQLIFLKFVSPNVKNSVFFATVMTIFHVLCFLQAYVYQRTIFMGYNTCEIL